MDEAHRTRRNLLRTAGALVFAPSLLSQGGCQSQRRHRWSLGPTKVFTLRINGQGPERVLAPRGPVRFPRPVAPTPLIGRVGRKGEEIVLRKPEPTESDATAAYRLAEIVHRLLRQEVGIERPALYILLFPVPNDGAFRIRVPLTASPGCTAGIPTIDGRLGPSCAHVLTYMLAHEATESFMVYPAIGGGALLYGDLRNRWVGEGMANVVASLALDEAVREGLGVAAVGYPEGIIEEYRKGCRLIRLEGWRAGQPDRGRYAAAQYLCHRWYDAAREGGHERPVAEFAVWLRTIPAGPSHHRVLTWLRETSRLDLGRQAQGVSIRDVARYHTKIWRARGWDPPAEAAALGDNGDSF